MRTTIAWISLAGLWLLVGFSGVAAAGGSAVPVPEPTSLALLAAGLGGAALLKLRRRK